MDERAADKLIAATHRVRSAAWFALVMLAVFLLFAALGEIKALRFIGSGIGASNTITVSGEGKTFVTPDIAEFSVTVQQTAKDVKSAQDAATKAGNAVIGYLKSQGLTDRDIQTSNYSIEPQYEYSSAICAQPPVPGGNVTSAGSAGSVIYCPPGKQTLTGYQVSETLDVKVRDTSKAGDILAGVGGKGASSVSGLNFTVDDPSAVQAEARDKAIADAKQKAQALAKALGVSLVRIVSYNEGGGGPIYYAKSAGMGAVDAAAPSPEIPVGQNTVQSDVTITYEIE